MPTRPPLRRTALSAAAVLGLTVAGTSGAAAAPPAAAPAPPAPENRPPFTPHFGPAIDRYSPYNPQTRCSPKPKPGAIALRAKILHAYPSTGDSGISRPCDVGGASEHKEGRAWDWHVSSFTQDGQARELLHWLLKTDQYGNRNALARRLGIMYIIYDKRIWGAYRASEGWRPYSCSGVTACHQDHVHFSMSWAGAHKRTSWWTGHPYTGREPAGSAVPAPWRGGTLPQPGD